MKGFLTEEEKQALVIAIAEAERMTSGEIRVHIDKSCKGDPLERAKQLFFQLKMYETVARNGVLIYVAPSDRKLAIVGDEGINAAVPADFWNQTKDSLLQAFKASAYFDGLSAAIQEVGILLKQFFPYEETDTDELSNEISEQQ